MATLIRFPGSDTIEVDEEIDDALDRWRRSGGEPSEVTIDAAFDLVELR